jgi:hypothetical protein
MTRIGANFFGQEDFGQEMKGGKAETWAEIRAKSGERISGGAAGNGLRYACIGPNEQDFVFDRQREETRE